MASADAVEQRLERRLVVLERHRRGAAADRVSRIQPNTGPSSALKVKLRKLTTPVAVPLICGGLASLITVYGSIAAPEAMPATRPSTYGGKHVGAAVENPREARRAARRAPPTITGLRRPIRSETKPSSGQPMIQPSGTVAERSTAVGVVEPVRLLQVAHAPDHVEDRRGDEQQARDHPAQDRLRIAEDDAERARPRLAQPVVALRSPVLAGGSSRNEQRR